MFTVDVNVKQQYNNNNHFRIILSDAVELHNDHTLRCTDSRTERQLSEEINGFPFRGRKCWLFSRVGGGVVGEGM